MTEPRESVKSEALVLGEKTFEPGQSGTVEFTVDHLTNHQPLTMEVHVFRGQQPGPCLLVSAGIHGNEICGVKVARLLLEIEALKHLQGDLIIVPVVNGPAYIAWSRYLLDKCDLNRLFPGSPIGSSGERLASLFVEEVIRHCTHAVDMHSGIVNRPNLPQVRISPEDEVALEMAHAFNVPVVVKSTVRDGSLRQSLLMNNKPALLYEAGEANRLDRASVRYGVHGVLSLMRSLSMLPMENTSDATPCSPAVVISDTYWERAPLSGMFVPVTELGQGVELGAVIGIVADPFGSKEYKVIARRNGVIIGCLRDGAVDKGDALFHIGLTDDPVEAEARIQEISRVVKAFPEEGLMN